MQAVHICGNCLQSTPTATSTLRASKRQRFLFFFFSWIVLDGVGVEAIDVDRESGAILSKSNTSQKSVHLEGEVLLAVTANPMKEVTCWVGTWSIRGSPRLNEEIMTSWLIDSLPSSVSSSSAMPHVVIVCLQQVQFIQLDSTVIRERGGSVETREEAAMEAGQFWQRRFLHYGAVFTNAVGKGEDCRTAAHHVLRYSCQRLDVILVCAVTEIAVMCIPVVQSPCWSHVTFPS